MSLRPPDGLPDARLRLAFLNQSRELILVGMLILVAAGRVLLGAAVPGAILAPLALWFGLAWAMARLCTGAVPGLSDTRLRRIEIGYFICELACITGLAAAAGVPMWLALLFYLATILYAAMVLPSRPVRWIAVLAAAAFSGLGAVRYRLDLGPGRVDLVWDRHPHYSAGMLMVLTLGGYGLIGVLLLQFSRMVNGHALALQTANHKLADAMRELRLHRGRLEDNVRQRTADLQRATDELRHANLELRRLNQVKSNFLANVSHELRTPLTSIRSFSEILLDYPDEDVFTRSEFLEIIKSESERLTRLINDVLDLAKIEAGRMNWHLLPVRCADLVRDALEAVQVVAAHRGLRLVNAVPPHLPLVHADPDRLRQVLTNLLSNALKFTPAGMIQAGALVRPAHDAAPGELILFIADTGVGIPAESLERIFEKFHQEGDALTDKPAGSGLGLAICREIMSHLGGRIWAESKERQGSVFYCALPIPESIEASVEAPAPPPEPPLSAAAAASTALPGLPGV